MDIEKMLRQFKETADEELLHEVQDTTALEKRIRSKMGAAEKYRLRTFWVVGTAAVAVLLVCFFTLHQLQMDKNLAHIGPIANVPTNPSMDPSPTSPNPSPTSAPTDEEIEEKVSVLKQQLKLGLTQEQVKKLLGSDYEVIDDGGDMENGADEFWGYSYFKKAGYVPVQPAYLVDEEGLQKRKVGANLFLGWKEKKLYLYSISYVKGEANEVIFYIANPDGTIKQENMTNPKPEEELEEGPFTLDLNKWQKQRYEEFARDKKNEALYAVDPIEIFKMYYYAEEKGDRETQYAFYYQGSQIPSLEQYLKDVNNDRVGAENERKFLKELREHGKRYKIEKMDEQSAVVWITYDHGRDPLGFQLKQEQKNVWKVLWMPIQ